VARRLFYIELRNNGPKGFLISNFRHVLNVVCFLLGNSQAPEFYMPTFRNTLLHFHGPMKMEQTACSKTSAYKIQAPGNYPEESIQQAQKTLNVLETVQYLVIPTLDYTVGLLKLQISTYAVKICHCKISSEMGGN